MEKDTAQFQLPPHHLPLKESGKPSLSRLAHTVSHLKPRQIKGQIARRIFPFLFHPESKPSRRTPPKPELSWTSPPNLPQPTAGANSSSTIRSGKFVFINREKQLGFPPKWNTREVDEKLWQYNLHYMDWLHSLPFEEGRQVTRDWIAKNPAKPLAVAWEPYPTSLRVANWIIYFFARHLSKTSADDSFREEIWLSIAHQLDHLANVIETHLLGNHLLENAVTLTLAGTCFKGWQAENWREIGFRELRRELTEQFPEDGLHFERSPMYHLRTTYLLNLLHQTGNQQLKELLELPRRRCVQALKYVTHPDGNIALFNDSAFNIYHSPRELLEQCNVADTPPTLPPSEARTEPPPPNQTGPWKLEKAGYYGFRDEHENYLICDAGAIGPDYIPGHAHCDLLSFELSLAGHRVLVDTGTFGYGADERRHYSRSTKAHNTVEIEKENQSDTWGTFRVGKRGYPRHVKFQPSRTGMKLEASHDGYQRAPYYAIHRRCFSIHHPFALSIVDRITAKRPITCRAYFHLAPECTLKHSTSTYVMIGFEEGEFAMQFIGEGRLTSFNSEYYPEFNVALDRTSLCYEISGTNVQYECHITRNLPAQKSRE